MWKMHRPTGRVRATNIRVLPYVFVAPAVLLVSAVSFLPLLLTAHQSVYTTENYGIGHFAGWSNFTRFFTELNGASILANSLILVVGTLLVTLPLGVALALILNQRIPFRTALRTILLLPWFVSSLATAMLWGWILNGYFTPLARVLGAIGIRMPNATADASFAMPSLVIANSWHQYPLVLVFVLAALNTVPSDVLEAARVDGATYLQRLRWITLPMIKNTLLVSSVLTTLNTFNNATLVFLMTGGGPSGSTTTMSLMVFLEGFRFYRTGIAAAIAVLCFIVNLVFSLAFIRVLRTSDAGATR